MTLRDSLRALPVFAADLPVFDTSMVPIRPDSLFVEWLADAIDAGAPEPHAMSLATVDAAGVPSSRVLVLKNLDESGWHFATDRTSRKGRELAATAVAALNFHWPALGRQVRVVGPVVALSAEDSAADFRARPSFQEGDDVNPDWQLYAVQANEVEFWQADRDRNHQRLIYRRFDGEWEKQ